MNTNDTIIAPATALGEGGIAVIRISGSNALTCLQRYFKPSSSSCSFQSHKLYHGYLVDSEGHHIDEIMAVYMSGPRSYTAEDTVEIHCHGSRQVVKRIIQLYQDDGVRIASPGEFTYRAFLNDRLDLAQAEAVARLIRSNSESSRRLALSQVEGELSKRIHAFADTVKHVLVLTEAWIDFPEEDLPDEDIDYISHTIGVLIREIDQMLSTYDYGRVQSEGASILLIGEPNVGKSSLLNALLGEERAIVTDVPGTTRDLLEEGLFIDDIPVRIIDTAGVRLTDDQIEVEGIRRAKKKAQEVDLILYLVDENDIGFQIPESHLCDFFGSSTFIVLTKLDRDGSKIDVSHLNQYPAYRVSSKTGSGLPELKEGIRSFFCRTCQSGETVMLTERRHFDVLVRARKRLQCFSDLLDGEGTLDLMSFELREVLSCLGMVSGAVTTENLLDDIFSGFCIGK